MGKIRSWFGTLVLVVVCLALGVLVGVAIGSCLGAIL